MNIMSLGRYSAFILCIGALLLSVMSVSATIYLEDGTAYENDEISETFISDYLSINEEPQRLVLFADIYCGSCQELKPWMTAFMEAYPDIIEEFDINPSENYELFSEYQDNYNIGFGLVPAIYVEGADGSGFVLEGIAAIKSYVEELVLGMYQIPDVFDEENLSVVTVKLQSEEDGAIIEENVLGVDQVPDEEHLASYLVS
jgi:thiol-disulfide isomerase/thioredoxin